MTQPDLSQLRTEMRILGAEFQEVGSKLDRIDDSIGRRVADKLTVIDKRVDQERPWWEKWLAGGIAATLIAAGLTFVAHYLDLRADRERLAREMAELRPSAHLVRQYRDLTTYALEQRKLTQQEVSQYVTGGAGVGPTGQPGALRITDPSERSQVGDGAIVRGTVNLANTKVGSSTCWEVGCRPRSDDRVIWVISQTAKNNRFYPQGDWGDQAGPALVNTAGRWISPPVFMGRTPRGERVLIHAVLADRVAEDKFKAYLRRGEETGDFPGLKPTELPQGVEIMDSIQVTRQ